MTPTPRKTSLPRPIEPSRASVSSFLTLCWPFPREGPSHSGWLSDGKGRVSVKILLANGVYNLHQHPERDFRSLATE
jgi:hypothetical protein